MRMIEQEIISAIRQEKEFSTSRTQDYYCRKEGNRDVLKWSDLGTFVYKLWGHEIAKGDKALRTLVVSDCGYPTSTTKSRLNAVFAALDIPMSCTVRKKTMVYFYKGQEMSKKFIETSDWAVTIS